MPRKTKETDEIKNNITKTTTIIAIKKTKTSPKNTTKSNNVSTSENKKTK